MLILFEKYCSFGRIGNFQYQRRARMLHGFGTDGDSERIGIPHGTDADED